MILARLGALARRAGRGRRFDAAGVPPRFLFLQINKRCNLRCLHCEFWRDDDADRDSYLAPAARRRLIGEFAGLNPMGAVVICGGEAMLDIADYFDVCAETRRQGLTSVSVINGTRVRTAAMAERMILEGPHEISVSLNSHRRELHDATRGVTGAFDKATRAVRLLVEARRKLGATQSRIYVMGLVFDENYLELEDFHEFVLRELGADKLKLNFLQPSFGGAEPDRFLADHHVMDAEALERVIRRCDARFGLRISPAWLAAVKMYVRSLARGSSLELGWAGPTRTRDHICNTYERNLMVDHYGVARLCFSTDFRGSPVREPGDLAPYWEGADDVRAQMRSCNRLCGISHSVRRVSATLSPAPYASSPPRVVGARRT